MKQKVHVLESTFYDKKKDGTALTYVSKKDQKTHSYKKVKLVIEGGKELWGASFSKDQDEKIKALNPEAETELEITETVKDGRTYYNWEFPKLGTSYATIAQVSQLVTRVEELEKFMHEVKSGKKGWQQDYEDFDLDEGVNTDEIPF